MPTADSLLKCSELRWKNRPIKHRKGGDPDSLDSGAAAREEEEEVISPPQFGVSRSRGMKSVLGHRKMVREVDNFLGSRHGYRLG